MAAYICKTKKLHNLQNRNAKIYWHWSESVIYKNGKKHIHTQDKKNGSKYIVQKKDLIILSKNKKNILHK